MSLWDWSVVRDIFPALWSGFLVTLKISAVSCMGAIVVGLALAVARRGARIERLVGAAIIEFVRSTPLLIQLYFLFYILPLYGVVIDAFWVGAAGMSLYFGAYCAEVFRGGFTGISQEQYDAITVLNFNSWDRYTRILLPQVVRSVVAPTGNYLVILFQESALTSAITINELLSAARRSGTESLHYIEPYTLAALLYLMVGTVLGLLFSGLERRLVVVAP